MILLKTGELKSSVFACVLFLSLVSQSFASVSLKVSGLTATVANGDVTIAFKADATVSSVKVKGVNIAATSSKSFYLDWNANGQGYFTPTKLTVVENTSTRAHFYWTQPGSSGKFNIELHYVMLNGISGIYSWAKYTNDQSSTVTLGETRTVYRFNPSVLTKGTNGIRTGTLYLYSYLNKQTKVQDETWKLPDGTYYTKYDYCGYLRDTPYHGVFGNGYGAFVISPSREYHGGGPLKQDLLVHQDSLISNYFVSSHFGGAGLSAPAGWNHIYGPWLIYFTTGSDSAIIADVKKRVETEKSSWPYTFVKDSHFPTARGSVSGTVTGQKSATVLIYVQSNKEEFQTQSLGYLYSTATDSNGAYSFANVRPGKYKVVAYPLAGQGSENEATSSVTVTAGAKATVAALSLPEPANIIWSIGETNRKSSEFKYGSKLRNYLYETLSPASLTFTIGTSVAANEWYYAQTKAGTWTVKYADTQDGKGRTLRVALAAASQSPHIIVTLNGHKIGDVYFGNDQSVYRSAMQSGTFHSNVFAVTKAQVVSGTNTLTFQLSKGQVMYDAISLQRS